MPEDRLDNRLAAVKELLSLFRLERGIYLGITFASLIILIVAAVALFTRDDTEKLVAAIGMFGSGGALTYTAGRLLRMWTDALQALDMKASDG